MMRQLLIILCTLITVGAFAQSNPNNAADAYQSLSKVNPNSATTAYISMAAAMKAPHKNTGWKFDVIENGVISHFITMPRSDGYLKPDSIMVIALADSATVAVRQAQELQVEWFKLPAEKDWYNAFQRLAKYVNAKGGNVTIHLNPKVYYIDTFKMGVPILQTTIITDTTIIIDPDGNPSTKDTAIEVSSDTVQSVTNKYIPNNITNIAFVSVQNVKILGYGATISVRGNFDRLWTHSTPSGFTHMSAYNTVDPIEFWYSKNIWIEGLELDGNNDQMTESTTVNEGEDYGIVMRSCNDVTLKNLNVHNFATDGVYLEGSGLLKTPSKRVTMENCLLQYNGRQALTIGGCFDCTFTNVGFNNTGDTAGMGQYKGHSPKKGVDIEPIFAYPGRTDLMTSDITFNNCQFLANKGGAFASSLYKTVKNVTIKGGTMNSFPYEPSFLIVAGLQNFTCDGVDMTYTSNTNLYLMYGAAITKKQVWKNNTIITGGTVTMAGSAQYGVTFENNLVIGRHDTGYANYFPNINGTCIVRNNTFVFDSNLYKGITALKKGQIQKATLVEGNTYVSQFDTSNGHPIIAVSYASTKTIRAEHYTKGQALIPGGDWNDPNGEDFAAGAVGIGGKQVAYVFSGTGKSISTYWLAALPTTGKYNAGDVIVCTNPQSTGVDHWRCMVGGDAALGTAAFAAVPISTTGGTVYHAPLISAGSDVFIGQNIDLGGTAKYSHAPLPNGGTYFTQGVNDTGMVVFKSPLGFTNLGEIIIKGTIYMRGKGNANFTISAWTVGNHTFSNPALSLNGDSSLLNTKVRWMKDANNDVYLAFFDSTTILPHQTNVHLESISLVGSTQSYLAHAALDWTPMLLRSLTGFIATTLTNNAGSIWANSPDYPRFMGFDNANATMSVNRTIGANTNRIDFGGSDGRTIAAFQNGVANTLNFNAVTSVFNSNLRVGNQKAIAFANWDNSNAGYATQSLSVNNTLDFVINGVNTLSLNSSNTTVLGGKLRLKEYTVATLPTGIANEVAVVTDALNPVNGATVVGGGATRVPVYFNANNWIAMGAGAGSGGTALSLTTTGTSGAATYNSSTGVLNIPVIPASFWQRSGTTLSPLNAGDNISTTGQGAFGSLKMTDGTQGAGKVLKSDVNGNGTWQTPQPLYGASVNVLGTSQSLLAAFDVYQMNGSGTSTFDLGSFTGNAEREVTIMNYMSSGNVTVSGVDPTFSSATTITPGHSITYKAMQGSWKPISQF